MLDFLAQYSYFGLFLIITAEEGGIPLPVPGDLFIAAVSALPRSNYFAIVTVVMVATLTGSTVLFTLSKKFGHMFILKFGRYVKITPEKVKKIENWFSKYGGRAIVIGRLIPGLRIITPLVAGTFKVSYKTFWLYTAVAAFVWVNVYFLIGKLFGSTIRLFH